jgi:multiple sugar transport system permease protein
MSAQTPVQSAAVSTPAPSLKVRISTKLEEQKVLGYVLMTPALLLILIFIAYPFVLGVWMSLTNKVVGTQGEFIGLANYAKLLNSDIFRTALNVLNRGGGHDGRPSCS